MISVVCNLCGSDDYKLRFPATAQNAKEPDFEAFRCTSLDYGSHAQIVECNQCGYVYSNPRLDNVELMARYASVEDDVYVEQHEGRRRTFSKHLHKLEQVTGPGNGRALLDVGAYTGVFVDVARSAGWDSMGVEPSRWAAQVAQRRGVPVLEGTLALPELQGQRYEVATMWDVIEHLDDPAAELARCYELLADGGVLAVHTMDVESLAARLLGPRWPWLMDMHIHYFSRRTLTQMLQKRGFEIIWVGAQGRYLSLSYLATRIGGVSRRGGQWLGRLFQTLRLDDINVPVNFGDLITVYARRPRQG